MDSHLIDIKNHTQDFLNYEFSNYVNKQLSLENDLINLLCSNPLCQHVYENDEKLEKFYTSVIHSIINDYEIRIKFKHNIKEEIIQNEEGDFLIKKFLEIILTTYIFEEFNNEEFYHFNSRYILCYNIATKKTQQRKYKRENKYPNTLKLCNESEFNQAISVCILDGETNIIKVGKFGGILTILPSNHMIIYERYSNYFDDFLSFHDTDMDFISRLFIKTFYKFNLDSYFDPNEYASRDLVNMFDTKGKKIGTSRGYEEDRDLSIAYYEGAI